MNAVAQSAAQSGLQARDVRLLRPTPEGRERAILDGVTATFPVATLSLLGGVIGSGKSTLLAILASILRPTSGEVWADGEPVSRFSPSHRDRWRRQVGLAFQASHFFDDLSVRENVMAKLVPTARSLRAAADAAQQELEALQVAHLADRALAGLSGGERQRVSLARALVGQPRYVFADEPTAHQDDAGAALIVERLSAVRDAGATVIVASHDGRIAKLASVEQIFTLKEGRLTIADAHDGARDDTP